MKKNELPCFFELNLNDLQCCIHLGNSSEERKIPQNVFFDITFRFLSIPQAAFTDDIQDTLCYGEICTMIEDYCMSKEFKLIEKLGLEIFQLLKNKISFYPQFSIQLGLCINKKKTPIENLLKGASFQIREFS